MFLSIKKIALLIMTMLLVSCASTEKKTKLVKTEKVLLPINHQLFQTQQTLNEEDIFGLSEDHKTEFYQTYNTLVAKGVKPHQALADYLDLFVDNFTYYGETYTAQTAFSLKKGNCMSLAVLTTALAKLIDVEFAYRNVYSEPVFSKQKRVIISSTHVKTIVYDPSYTKDENYIYFSTPGITIDYFPSPGNIKGGKLNYENFLSKFYQNLASDALIADNIDLSFSYAYKAYQLDTTAKDVLNLLAILHKRKGDMTTAEEIFISALSSDDTNLALLSNYHSMLNMQGRNKEADVIKEKQDNLYDPNPYNWLQHAYIAKLNNKLSRAEFYFKKAIKVAPYVTESYKGLYQIYVAQNEPEKAKKMMIKALDWTYELEERRIYQFKLSYAEQLLTKQN